MNRIPRLLIHLLTVGAVTSLNAADYWVSPNGSGTEDGSNEANALPKSQIGTTINTTMGPGDTLYLASGDYNSTQITLNSDGTASAPKRIIGVDTGGGIPHIKGDGTWKRWDPENGQWKIFGTNGSHWEIENLELSGVAYAIYTGSGQSASHLHFKDITIHDIRHGVYVRDVDDTIFENVTITHYTKQGFRLQSGCDNVTFQSCYTDQTDGDTTWWDHSEPHPYGFVSYASGGANTNISFIDCTAKNNRRNLQNDGYWNGDGFVIEGASSGITFTNCTSINNEDGGFDIKVHATLTDCISIKNYRGFRLWSTGTLENCVAIYPFRRTNSNPTGSESGGGSGFWTKNGSPTANYFTFYGNTGRGADEEGSGSLTVTNSIIAFSGTNGSFKSGNVTLGTGTVTYRPGSGADPDFVSPSISWNGIGDDMNSITYGQAKGYNSQGSGGDTDTAIEELLPDADSYAFSGSASTNYGTVTNLLVKDSSDSGYNRISFLRFPLSALSDTALSATLKLKVNALGNEGSGDRLVRIRQVSDDTWTETGITWSNMPALGTTIATINATTVGQVYEVNVTDFVVQEQTGDGYVTIALEQPNDDNRLVNFFSRESTGNEPSLEVEVSAETVSTISASEDTYVYNSSANTNYGDQADLLVKNNGGGYKRISYIKFPLSSLSGTADLVEMSLVVTGIGGEGSGSRTVELGELNDDTWEESTVTWNNKPTTPTDGLIASFDAGSVNTEYVIDVTDYINQEYNGDQVASFALVQPSSVGKLVRFGSRESSGDEPILTIEPTSTTIAVAAEADTYAHDGNPTTNYGSNTGLAIKDGNSGYDRVAFIRFPLSEIEESASQAFLNLTVTGVGSEGSGAKTVEVRQLSTDTWDESTLTWNNKPATNGTLIASFDASTVGTQYSIDVTDYVNQEHAADGVVSFVLIQPTATNRYVTIGSRENTGYGPTLEIEE